MGFGLTQKHLSMKCPSVFPFYFWIVFPNVKERQLLLLVGVITFKMFPKLVWSLHMLPMRWKLVDECFMDIIWLVVSMHLIQNYILAKENDGIDYKTRNNDYNKF